MGHPPLLELLDDRDERYELVDGLVVVTPPARFQHERLSNRLRAALLMAAPIGLEVLGPDYGVLLGGADFFVPDAVVARAEDCEELGTSSPLLVVEVLSPSTSRYDRGPKRERYAELGIPAYWLVDPDVPELEVLELRDGSYVEVARGSVLDVVHPFPLRIDLTG